MQREPVPSPTVQQVDVVRFVDQYEQAAPAFGMSAESLRSRDAARGQPILRWLALVGGEAREALTISQRPDRRLFASFAGRSFAAFPDLIGTAAIDVGRNLYTIVDLADVDLLATLAGVGFEREMVAERSRVRFDRALSALGRAAIPSGYSVESADQADLDRLVVLDNTLRDEVSGTDGWRGDRQWMAAELAECPPFDRSAYLVAVDRRSGEYAGLVRMWRNPRSPRFGLIGVVREHRGTTLAAGLIRRALVAASAWGSPTFETETSLSNLIIYPRMARVRAESLGRFAQLVLRHPAGR